MFLRLISLLMTTFLLSVALWAFSQGPKPAFIDANVNQYKCAVAHSNERQDNKGIPIQENDTLEILFLMPTNAIQFADTLCATLAEQTQFSFVRITWRPRAIPEVTELLTTKYDVIWNREYILNGLVTEFSGLYKKLGETQRYSSFWLTNKPSFPFETHTLQDMRIGLYKDKMSRSSYVLPLRSLNERGMLVESLNIQYFPSFNKLHQALIDREVDMIATFDADFINSLGNDFSTQTIAQDIPIGAWFIKEELFHKKNVTCSLAAALDVFKPVQLQLAESPRVCLGDDI